MNDGQKAEENQSGVRLVGFCSRKREDESQMGEKWSRKKGRTQAPLVADGAMRRKQQQPENICALLLQSSSDWKFFLESNGW